jgi:hypothetical protein
MRILNKEWHYNGVYELRVELTQKSIAGYDKKGYPLYKYIITPQVFYGMSKKECLDKLEKYKYNDSHMYTFNCAKEGLLKYL